MSLALGDSGAFVGGVGTSGGVAGASGGGIGASIGLGGEVVFAPPSES